MTLQEALSLGKLSLKDENIEYGDLDAWYLLEYVCEINRSYYYLHMKEEMESKKQSEYMKLIEKRGHHIPLQHITGEQEFMGLRFKVNEHVLVPRQDTETLVQEVLKVLKSGMTVLDMCTGSGCILISLLSLGDQITGTGADISEEALKIARANALINGAVSEFIKSDLFEHINDVYDLIVSNPPYIPTDEIEGLMEEVKQFEPRIALDGSEDGLLFYRGIINESRRHLKKGGKLFFETGCDQGEEVSMLMKEKGFVNIHTVKDLAGLQRVVYGTYLEEES